MRRKSILIRDLVALTALARCRRSPPSPASQAATDGTARYEPRLIGRAVLPVDTLAEGPPSGAAATSANGITFPRPSQPVEGFSAIVDGRRPGEFLAMPDNGYGNKANSADFLIRAYYLRPDFKTARAEPATSRSVDFIQFRDPYSLIGFPIVNEATTERLLTGADIDPESIQRGRHGDLWVGDEFGPWILHFDSQGRLLDPPFAMPDGLRSPNNPHLPVGHPATQPTAGASRRWRSRRTASSCTPRSRAPGRRRHRRPAARHVFEFSVKNEAFTGRTGTTTSRTAETSSPTWPALDLTTSC